MSFKKHYFLFIFFGLFVLVLVPTGTSLATITGTGCESAGTVTYCTECGDKCFTIGHCNLVCCKCCGEDEDCTKKYCEKCTCEAEPWYEYKCDSSDCDGDIDRRRCEVYKDGNCPSNCESDQCCVRCTKWELCRECGSWQKPIRGEPCTNCSLAGLQTPDDIFKCKCKGECIDTPVNDKYFNDPTIDLDSPENCHLLHATNLSCYDQDLKQALLEKIGRAEMDKNKVFLPVKLDWDPVRGDINGWAEGNECKICQDCPEGCSDECYDKPECVKSYEIIINGEMRSCEALKKIDELKEDIEKNPQNKAADENKIEIIRKYELDMSEPYATTTDKSEFIPPCSCMFKSNRAYTWHVKACCDAGGTSCGPESDWSFTTSPAPEPKLPYDPDWAGPGRSINLTKEQIEKLKWCEIDDQLEWQGADGNRYNYHETTVEGEEYYRPLTYKVLVYYKKEEGGEDLCHPNLKREGECHELILTPDEAAGELFPPFQFWDKDHIFFTKLTPYAWKVAACKDISANYCTDYSQFWRFSAEDFILDKPQVVSPPNDEVTPVGLPVLISWSSPYAMSWNYEVSGGIGQGKTSTHNVSFDWPQLQLNTVYSWKVQPCWDFESKDCEDIWSDTYFFKTTGRPPNLIKPGGSNISIPVIFEWESVPGAKSYWFKIQGDGLNKEVVVEESKTSLDYPDLHQETDYSWQVKTCAKEKEEACVKNQTCCGAWSSANFTTFKLGTPSNPSPPDNQKVFTYEMPGNFSWEPVPYARYYKYTINYVSKSADEATEECQPQERIVEKIVTQPSDFVSLNCLGEYEWQVTACLDAGCQETGDPSSIWLFELVQSGGPGGGGFVGSLTGGLVPCGRTFDDPNTPWNERDSCQIKHIFILIKSIIDFLLWKLAPLLLVFLLVYTGAIYYLAMGAPEAIARVKSLWRAAGIGYLLIFIAWNIVSFALTLFGYRVGIFGPWWKIF